MLRELPKKQNAHEQYDIPYGYYATKGDEEIKVYTEVYNLGIFIYFYKNNKIYNQVSNDTPKRLKTILTKTMKAFIEDSYEITPIPGDYVAKRDANGYFLPPKGYINHRYSKLNKK